MEIFAVSVSLSRDLLAERLGVHVVWVRAAQTTTLFKPASFVLKNIKDLSTSILHEENTAKINRKFTSHYDGFHITTRVSRNILTSCPTTTRNIFAPLDGQKFLAIKTREIPFEGSENGFRTLWWPHKAVACYPLFAPKRAPLCSVYGKALINIDKGPALENELIFFCQGGPYITVEGPHLLNQPIYKDGRFKYKGRLGQTWIERLVRRFASNDASKVAPFYATRNRCVLLELQRAAVKRNIGVKVGIANPQVFRTNTEKNSNIQTQTWFKSLKILN